MKKIDYFIVRLLLFFYLTSSYLSATHIHKDGLEHHPDCKICIITKNLHTGDTPNLDIGCLTCDCNYEMIVSFKNPLITITIFKGFNANAPPYFS